jgi:hypothetical protein
MEDEMTGENYLLYSPGLQETEAELHPRLWFLLIANNGDCWQTFGLIIPFKTFTKDDLFFFATELNPQVTDEETLMKETEENPIPFFMLLSASNFPATASRGYRTLICQSTDVVDAFSTVNLSGNFTITWRNGVCQFRLKKMEAFPHFAIAYYHTQRKEIMRSALTEAGFAALARSFAEAGYDLQPDADIVVSPAMLSATEKVMDKKIVLNPYENLFSENKLGQRRSN